MTISTPIKEKSNNWFLERVQRALSDVAAEQNLTPQAVDDMCKRLYDATSQSSDLCLLSWIHSRADGSTRRAIAERIGVQPIKLGNAARAASVIFSESEKAGKSLWFVNKVDQALEDAGHFSGGERFSLIQEVLVGYDIYMLGLTVLTWLYENGDEGTFAALGRVMGMSGTEVKFACEVSSVIFNHGRHPDRML